MHQLDFFIFGDEDESNEGVEFVKQIRQRDKLIIQCNDHWGEENNIFNNTDLHNEEKRQKLSVPPKNTANGSPRKRDHLLGCVLHLPSIYFKLKRKDFVFICNFLALIYFILGHQPAFSNLYLQYNINCFKACHNILGTLFLNLCSCLWERLKGPYHIDKIFDI